MVTKIFLLKISAAASLLECERATQDFIIAANAVFIKAQGLTPALANELPAPVVAPKTIMDPAPTPASATLTLPPTQEQPSQWVVPHNKGKDKAKVMEEDEDKEGEATQKLRKELENFVVLTKFDDKFLVSLLPLPMEYYEGDTGLPQGAKILGGKKGDITLVSSAMWALVLEKNSAETLQSKDTDDANNNDKDSNDDEDDDEGSKDNDDDSDNDNDAAMNVDGGNLDAKISKMLCPEETWPTAPTKVMVTKVVALMPVPLTKLKRMPFFKFVKQWQNHVRGHYEVVAEMLEDVGRHFESVRQELQWAMHQHNALALYLCDCNSVRDWHEMNNMELGEFSDTKDLPIIGSFPVIYPN
ncbi:hypothetical protein C0995_002002 [Termitomyces sp. Mi166|nr:hypothetical protein C0995_002002 [Termitomyces sp. Mi166\